MPTWLVSLLSFFKVVPWRVTIQSWTIIWCIASQDLCMTNMLKRGKWKISVEIRLNAVLCKSSFSSYRNTVLHSTLPLQLHLASVPYQGWRGLYKLRSTSVKFMTLSTDQQIFAPSSSMAFNIFFRFQNRVALLIWCPTQHFLLSPFDRKIFWNTGSTQTEGHVRNFAAFHQLSSSVAHLAHHDISIFHSWHPLHIETFCVDLPIIIKPLRTVLEWKYRTCVCSRTGETPPVLCLYQSLLKACWDCFPLLKATVVALPFLVPDFSEELHLIGNVSS